MWTVRSIQDDIIIEQRKGYCIAEYEPLQLKCEGGTEREARDALMLDIWASVAKMYEAEVIHDSQIAMRRPRTIKEFMDLYISNYWMTHTPKPRYRDEKVGVIELEVEVPDGVTINPDGTYDVTDMRLLTAWNNESPMPETSREETEQDMEKE